MKKYITTATFAKSLDIKPASIRSSVWRRGHYNGIKPSKLPNGRLVWPADAIDQITGASQDLSASSK